MLFYFGRFLFWLIFKSFFELKVIGHENVPVNGPAIICANHQSFMDPPLVGSSLKRPLNFLARHDLFKVPVFGWLIKHVRAYPVNRTGAGDPAAFKNIFRLIAKEEMFLLFPEGTRSRDGNLQKPLPGVGMIAHHTRVPIIPCYIAGSWEAFPRNRKFPKIYPLKVIFGKSIDLSEYYGQPKSKQLFRQISDKIMAEIALLKENNL